MTRKQHGGWTTGLRTAGSGSSRRGRLVKVSLAGALLLLGLLAGGRPLPAAAATITDNDCSSTTGYATLQSDINSANSGDVIRFTCSGTINFTSQIVINTSLTIDGIGQQVILNGQNLTRIFDVDFPGLSFEVVDLTLENGNANKCSCAGSGGAIAYFGSVVGGGMLTVIGSTFVGNQATQGGAIRVQFPALSVTASTFSGNQATAQPSFGVGGAISAQGNTATITNSTFFNNSATGTGGSGGAIYVLSETLTITNSTLANNSAPGAFGSGGGIENFPGGTATLHATILANNSVGAGGSGPDCWASITSNDYNLIDNSSGCTITGTTTHDLDNVPATFQSFGNYGGPTSTLPLTTTSNGYDYIPLASCGTAADQRDFVRGDGGESTCDIGATETGASSCAKPTFSAIFNSSTNSMSVTATDNNVGLDSLSLAKSGNANVTIPSFTPGAHSVTATVTRQSAGQPARVSFQATNTLECTADPVPVALAVVPGQPLTQMFTDIPASESRVLVSNGRPGLTILVLWVNGKPVVLSRLQPGGQQEVSIASALHTGSNTVQVLGLGPLGSSATVLIGE